LAIAYRGASSNAYQRAPTGSEFDGFGPEARRLLAVSPSISAVVLAERVDWSGASSVFRAKAAEMRPECVVTDPAARLDQVASRRVV